MKIKNTFFKEVNEPFKDPQKMHFFSWSSNVNKLMNKNGAYQRDTNICFFAVSACSQSSTFNYFLSFWKWRNHQWMSVHCYVLRTLNQFTYFENALLQCGSWPSYVPSWWHSIVFKDFTSILVGWFSSFSFLLQRWKKSDDQCPHLFLFLLLQSSLMSRQQQSYQISETSKSCSTRFTNVGRKSFNARYDDS